MGIEKSLVAFEKGMREASDIIQENNPDIVIAPMMGSVPFVDAMNVVNHDFDSEKVYYMPASSGIANVKSVMRDWMGNFLDEHADENGPLKIMGIDEVVSGSSSTRVYRAITESIGKKKKQMKSKILSGFNRTDVGEFENAALYFDSLTDSEHHDFISMLIQMQRNGTYETNKEISKKHNRELMEKVRDYCDGMISYMGIGIQDSKMDERGRNKEYGEIVDNKGIIPIDVDRILTMDNPELCPSEYRELKNGKGNVHFSPVVENFRVTRQYINLLQRLAQISGKNPNRVSPVNMPRIFESNHYLSPKYLSN